MASFMEIRHVHKQLEQDTCFINLNIILTPIQLLQHKNVNHDLIGTWDRETRSNMTSSHIWNPNQTLCCPVTSIERIRSFAKIKTTDSSVAEGALQNYSQSCLSK
jgi:hypothetical protein